MFERKVRRSVAAFRDRVTQRTALGGLRRVVPYGEELCRASGLCGASADEDGRRHVVSGTARRTESAVEDTDTPAVE
ncbi:Hypothetical protein SMAX5B_015962 [Scophthalmus maximus]|uniref:Uncharacterized protein n=1 Tax=Scophthalmus maximus TaxID=52904 RepID=A0A2U9CS57_SCOMX|nr:Hypothetical protein SMAX5B_015962 [Scophthalmus maximus]